MSWFMFDIEADGQIPGDFSMVSLGVVKVADLNVTFYGELRPISDKFDPEALKISGHTREKTLLFADPKQVMINLNKWILENNSNYRPLFISDNNGFDWQFINWYFHHFLGSNPLGHSSTNLGSLYKGMQKSVLVNFKHLRKTKHNHHPVDDAMSNAEALLAMKQMGLEVEL